MEWIMIWYICFIAVLIIAVPIMMEGGIRIGIIERGREERRRRKIREILEKGVEKDKIDVMKGGEDWSAYYKGRDIFKMGEEELERIREEIEKDE